MEKYRSDIESYEKKYGKIIKNKKIGKSKESEEEREIQKQIEDLKLPEKPKKPLTAFFLYR